MNYIFYDIIAAAILLFFVWLGCKRGLVLTLASLLAGSVISFTGMIGFVGLIVPHMVRRLSPGPLMKQLVSCLLLGPAFLLLADLLARTVAAPYEIPAGILLTLAGGPYFLWLLLKGKGHGHD